MSEKKYQDDRTKAENSLALPAYLRRWIKKINEDVSLSSSSDSSESDSSSSVSVSSSSVSVAA